MDLVEKYLNESEMGTPEHKLFLKYMDIRNKADKMWDQMKKMSDQVSIIQKQTKKIGLSELTDHKGRPVLNINDDPSNVVWRMFSGR